MRAASASTVTRAVLEQARRSPDAIAVREGERTWTYAAFVERAGRLAAALMAQGVESGDRIAVLSENRAEYLELLVAAGWIGAVVACQNWRLAPDELRHCVELVEPRLALASGRHAAALEAVSPCELWRFGDDYEARLEAVEVAASPTPFDPESPLLILYTSGTTGRPKGAVISHRAELVRNLVTRAEYGLMPVKPFVAWSPMYHLGGAEYSIGTLVSGGEVIVLPGFDPETIVDLVATRELGWLILMPGMVGKLADQLEARAVKPKGVQVCGVMPDLVPTSDIARITRLLDAPYANTFGATETGNPPASAGLLPIAKAPKDMAKTPSPFCEIRLVGPDGADVPDGTPGELWMRGPTLFSGYWEAPEANAESFAEGWFHMGDVFVRRPDGRIDFVDRVKYLIKSGGENIYPAEIERVLLDDPRVAEAAVVRRPDARWGEVPVAFVARRDPALTEGELLSACRTSLAGYKQPKALHFIDLEDFPRSASGKVQRHELEARLSPEGADHD